MAGQFSLRVRTLLAACLALAAAGTASAQDDRSPVAASLLFDRAGIAPGGSVEALVRLEHAPGWHTFWQNPGAGEATRIAWQLPAGWQAGPIRWPAPETILSDDSTVFGHGFSHEVYLPVTLTAVPDANIGDPASVQATVTWLACKGEICLNGTATLETDLPVVASAQGTDAGIAAGRQLYPSAPVGWTLAARLAGDRAVLEATAPHAVQEPRFFPGTEMIWHDSRQTYEATGKRLTVSMPLDPFYAGDKSMLSGVLRVKDEGGVAHAVQVAVPLVAAPQAGETRAAVAFSPSVLLLAFLGGLILNLMPCVLPVLSLKALSLGKIAGQGRAAARADGLAYTAGVVSSFVLVGALMLAARATMGEVGWGFHLQQPVVILSLVLLMVAVGLNLFGLFEMGVALQGFGTLGAGRGGNTGSFLTGVLAVVVAAPCTAPFMASALGVALVQPVPTALGIFVCLGFGLAFPYLLISLVPGISRFLPKPGAWMENFRQLLAFPMFGTAAWLLWVLGGQTGPDGMLAGLGAALLLAFALWAWGRGARVWRVCALAAALGMGGTVYLATMAPGPGPRATEAADTAYSPERLEALLVADKPVFAYFTADWCVTCKVNERVAIRRAETEALFRDKGITVLVGDWTRQDPAITAMLELYGRAGVPMYLYFPPGTDRAGARLLPQILTPAILRDAVAG